MATSPNLGITYLEEGQQSAEVTLNDGTNILDVLVQPTVIDKDLTTPPGSPTDGDRYIVGGSATGGWSGQDDKIALYFNGWVFITPAEGWHMFVQDENGLYYFDGSAWQPGARLPTMTDGTRGTAGAAGRVIYNSTDGGLNVDNGSSWRAPSGGWVNT